MVKPSCPKIGWCRSFTWHVNGKHDQNDEVLSIRYNQNINTPVVTRKTSEKKSESSPLPENIKKPVNIDDEKRNEQKPKISTQSNTKVKRTAPKVPVDTLQKTDNKKNDIRPDVTENDSLDKSHKEENKSQETQPTPKIKRTVTFNSNNDEIINSFYKEQYSNVDDDEFSNCIDSEYDGKNKDEAPKGDRVSVELRLGGKLYYDKKNSLTSYEEIASEKKMQEKPVSEFLQTSKSASKKRKEGVLISMPDTTTDIIYTDKDDRTKELIEAAFMANDFIKNLLDKKKLQLVIQAMQPEEIKANTYIIREGETGSHLYVSDEGNFSVLQNTKVLKTFGPGEAFGELAILYKSKRFASVIANTDSKIWLLERKMFQKIMVKSKKQDEEENIKFLKSVPDLKHIHPTNIIQMNEFFKRKFFPANTAIIHQGDVGDTFYIIKGGTVNVSKNLKDGKPDTIVNKLKEGDYFGEQALIHDDVRSATIIANPPGVECLVLERGPFNEFLGDLSSLKKRRNTIAQPRKPIKTQVKHKVYDNIELSDLRLLGTLGVGAFGRVELMQSIKNENLTFAVKKLKKFDMVMQQIEKYAFNEKNIMYMCKSPFICKLYRTYKDNKYLYFLMEPLLGGDLWSVLQKTRGVEEKTAKFVTGCVVEAFEYLHSRDIVYRDLKPENIMLDAKGYVKLVDFGYAKILPNDVKTHTFAGTPEYVAPEIILGNAHDRAVDYWTLGIFIYELLSGKPPFRGTNHVNTYSLIVRGIDEVPFSGKITPMAQSLIRKLCRPIAVQRLGYLRRGIKDIKTHKWFHEFDWKKLRNCKMTAPLVVNVENNKDRRNFEHYEEDMAPPDEYSGFDNF